MDEFDYIYMWLKESELLNKKVKKIHTIFDDIRELRDVDKNFLVKNQILDESEADRLFQVKSYQFLEEKYFKYRDMGISFVHFMKDGFPDKLKKVFDCPYALYVKGNIPELKCPTVAIVGARICSEYGREVAYKFGKELSNAGVGVVSGLAKGIDSYAHKGALAGQGSTYGILGCGVDICYPRENIKIYSEILDRGGVISEYLPGAEPVPYRFPMRNRIISGMSDAVIVVEAREKSGSLITVDQALEQNREVFVVPGRITDKLSIGCNNLVKMGATPVNDISDVLEYLNSIYHINVKKSSKKNISLATNEKMVYSCLDLYPKNISDIMNEIDLEMQEILGILMRLQGKGIIRESSKNYYVISME